MAYFEVLLTAPGGQKVRMLKLLSARMGISLGEAKSLLADLPFAVAELPLDEARALAAELEAIDGAETRLLQTSRFDPVEGATYTLVILEPGPRLADVIAWVAAFRPEIEDPEYRIDTRGEIAPGLSLDEIRRCVAELEDLGARPVVRVRS